MKQFKDSNKVQLLRSVSKLDYTKARKGTQISTLYNEIGEDQTMALLSGAIINFTNSVKVNLKMGDDDCVEIALTLMVNHWGMKIEQLLHFMSEFKHGKFGDVWKLDQMTFHDKLNKYLEKADIDREREMEKLKNNKYEKDEPRSGTDMERLQEVTKKLKPNE